MSPDVGVRFPDPESKLTESEPLRYNVVPVLKGKNRIIAIIFKVRNEKW